MKTIIVGGGRLGKQLAETLPDSVIIEKNHSKVQMLRAHYGNNRVIEGTGTSREILKEAGIEKADAIVVATDNDHTNYLIALLAEEFGVPKVIVRVDDPQNVDIFHQIGIETIICPAIIAAKMINSTLYPTAREITEVHVFENSPFEGKRVGEISLPADCNVVAILRGYQLVRPTDDLLLKKGDHLIMCSLTGVAPIAKDVISGVGEKLRPFENIMTVVRSDGDLEAIKETAYLAKNFDIQSVIISGDDVLIKEAVRIAESFGVSLQTCPMNISRLENLIPSLPSDLSNIQCVAIRLDSRYNRSANKKDMLRFIKSSRIPILITKGTFPYSKILTIMGSAEVCEYSVTVALKMALLTGAELHVMNYRDPEDVEQERMLNIKRMGNMYGIEVKEEVVEGNPTIEFVSRVTSEEFDLTVVNWESNILKKDVLRRMFFEASMSILIYVR